MRTLIWATGGGLGHATRGRVLGERLAAEGDAVTVVHSAPDAAGASEPPVNTVSLQEWAGDRSVATVRSALEAALRSVDRLVVDTFPLGVDGALRGVSIPERVETVLVARWVDRARVPEWPAGQAYDEQVAAFDAVWFPYAEHASEWDDPPAHPNAHWLGPITRPVTLSDERVDTLVIGDAPPGWSGAIEAAVADGGRWVTTRFEQLPRANAVVALAAGYNLAWELVGLGFPALGFHPLPRRYDDQFARAARLGTPLYHRADLERFLRYHRRDHGSLAPSC